MKRICVSVIFGIFVNLICGYAFGQDHPILAKPIEPYLVSVCYNKTSNFIFPYAVKSVDRGSPSIIVQKAKGAENILQVKANARGFVQTNLSVITADGGFYSFVLDYAEDPSALNISFVKDSADHSGNVLLSNAVSEASLQAVAKAVAGAPSFLHVREKEQKMRLSLESIYLHSGLMWFSIDLENQSLIDYKPQFVRFFLRDKKRAKRTAVQETEIEPIFHTGLHSVQGNGIRKLVFAFRPFTIPQTKEVMLQVEEEGGGRQLMLPIRHRVILKARLLNECAFQH